MTGTRSGTSPRIAAAIRWRGVVIALSGRSLPRRGDEWPAHEARDPALWFRGYEQTYLERDVWALARVSDRVSFRNLLRLAALRTGQLLNQSDLARDARLPVSTVSRRASAFRRV